MPATTADESKENTEQSIKLTCQALALLKQVPAKGDFADILARNNLCETFPLSRSEFLHPYCSTPSDS